MRHSLLQRQLRTLVGEAASTISPAVHCPVPVRERLASWAMNMADLGSLYSKNSSTAKFIVDRLPATRPHHTLAIVGDHLLLHERKKLRTCFARNERAGLLPFDVFVHRKPIILLLLNDNPLLVRLVWSFSIRPSSFVEKSSCIGTIFPTLPPRSTLSLVDQLRSTTL